MVQQYQVILQELFRSENRYRDIAFSPDGSTVYVITDPAGPVQAMKEGPITPTTTLWSPGALVAIKYVGGEEATRLYSRRNTFNPFQPFSYNKTIKQDIIKNKRSFGEQINVGLNLY